ncbi:MAG TPA: 2-phosphosulfolactate phosphatase [Ktedonosporobacter sp.]|nr:2-phosphosulfolactate phosphatase [Ktedonosporobacter sp.]
MDIFKIDRHAAAQARGIVVVIDVIRAFSVAGYAFAGGAQGIWLVRTVEEAQALRTREPEALLIGEIEGRLIPGFDLNNSPARMATAPIRSRQLIQRTGAGTQGAVNASHASMILLCALTNARATAQYAHDQAESRGEAITILPTSFHGGDEYWNEDRICADYIEALLLGQEYVASDILAKGIAYLHETNRFSLFQAGSSDFPIEDIAAVLDVNRFNFAIAGSAQRWQGIPYVNAQCIDLDNRE